ncbi:hypothetical protein MTO96_051662, partial [Rhipicephalus appendiculatus]
MRLVCFVQALFLAFGGASPTPEILPLKLQDFADKRAGNFVTVRSIPVPWTEQGFVTSTGANAIKQVPYEDLVSGHGEAHRLGSLTMRLVCFVQALFLAFGGASPTPEILPLKLQDFADKRAGNFVTVRSIPVPWTEQGFVTSTGANAIKQVPYEDLVSGHGEAHRLGSLTMRFVCFVQALFLAFGGASPTPEILPLKLQDFADKRAVGNFVTVRSIPVPWTEQGFVTSTDANAIKQVPYEDL